jgi:hypothetical protein
VEAESLTVMVGMYKFIEDGTFSTDWGVFAAGSFDRSAAHWCSISLLQRSSLVA